VERFTEVDGKATDRKLIIEDLPVGICCHNGGRLGFGPDGKLYILVGDVNERQFVQGKKRMHGKVLRINADGTIPDDNPFPGSPIFAIGFRNPWGLDFHPITGRPYISENGPDNHDEVNLIMSGANYGNPEVEGRVNDPRFLDPVWDSGEDRLAPTGLIFYTGNLMPQYKNDMFFCSYNYNSLMHVRLAGENFDQVSSIEPLVNDCHLDVANGPDGAIYITKISRFAPPK
jgi:glucose/arabinose dehydrogenase